MLDETNLVGKLATFAIIGLLSWLVYTVQQISVQQAVQSAEIKSIQNNLLASQQDRFTRSEAIANSALIEQRLNTLEVEKESIRDRLRKLEAR